MNSALRTPRACVAGIGPARRRSAGIVPCSTPGARLAVPWKIYTPELSGGPRPGADGRIRRRRPIERDIRFRVTIITTIWKKPARLKGQDQKSGVKGKSVDHGGSRITKKKQRNEFRAPDAASLRCWNRPCTATKRRHRPLFHAGRASGRALENLHA